MMTTMTMAMVVVMLHVLPPKVLIFVVQRKAVDDEEVGGR